MRDLMNCKVTETFWWVGWALTDEMWAIAALGVLCAMLGLAD